MISRLQFDVDWLTGDHGGDAERACFGALTLTADGQVLTRAIDLLAQTTRDCVRVSLNHLAGWLADNWWRLRWEPAPMGASSIDWQMAHELIDWQMAHELAAAGGGYVWPSLRFTCDGQSVRIQTWPTKKAHTVQYLEQHDLVCGASTWERAVDDLLDQVLARQHSLAAVDSKLRDTWTAMVDERNDPEATRFRKHEAMLGLDADEHDADSLATLFERGEWMGVDALDETLASSDAATFGSLLDHLEKLRSRSTPRLSFRETRAAAYAWTRSAGMVEPWQQGASLAKHLRAYWDLGSKPVQDQFLNDLLGEDIHSETLAAPNGTTVVAFRDGEDGEYVVPALKPTRIKESRRFAIARLLADAAAAAESDALHPLTRTHTARQKFQRSAAQEFLCPTESLRERLTLPNPDEDEIADAASYFQVSPVLVTTTLVNKKLVPRSFLDDGRS